jgi:hypothetical protein
MCCILTPIMMACKAGRAEEYRCMTRSFDAANYLQAMA